MLDQAGRCDVLVHAAAAFDRADLSRLDLAVWRRVQAVNVESAPPRSPARRCAPMAAW